MNVRVLLMNCLMVLEHGKFPLEAQTPRSVNHPPRRRRDTDTSAGTCTGINLLPFSSRIRNQVILKIYVLIP